jgi:hypothetical protein
MDNSNLNISKQDIETAKFIKENMVKDLKFIIEFLEKIFIMMYENFII